MSLAGTVTVTGTTVRLNGATIRILDGLNAGRTTTTANGGMYRFDDLMPSNGNVSATAAGWEEARAGTYIDGVNTINFTIRSINPWSRNGSGNDVFDMPAWVTRVRVRGVWSGVNTSNFIVYVGGRLVVNEVLRNLPNRTYEGVHSTTGGLVEVKDSSTISWTLTEVR